MKTKHFLARGLAWMMILVLAIPPGVIAQRARGYRDLKAGRIGPGPSAHRAAPGSFSFANFDGFDLSLGSRAGRTLGKAKRQPKG